MPKSNNKDKRERQAILNAMGVKLICISPPEYHKTDCSICLKKTKGEQFTLQCGHAYNGECLKHWGM